MTDGSTARKLERLVAADPSAPRPIAYSGFPWWHALLVTPGHETKSADLLERFRVMAYLPRYTDQVRCGRRGRVRAVLRPVVPGLLFVPREMMDIDHRAKAFDFCHLRGFLRGASDEPALITKSEIEELRWIEAKLEDYTRVPAPRDWTPKPGDHVRFRSGLYTAFLGKPIVIELERRRRIRLGNVLLFGQPREIVVPLADVEPDVADAAEA